jgi:hypothetical protein
MRSLVPLTVLLLAAGPAPGQTPEEKKATVAFLQKLQHADGGFVAAPVDAPKSSLRATSSGVRALKYFGGSAKDLDAARKYVESCFDAAAGGFADTPGGKPEVATTAVGLMAVAELKLPAEKYQAPCVKYLLENAKDFEQVRIAAAGLEAAGGIESKAVPLDWWKQMPPLRDKAGSFVDDARTLGGTVAAMLRLGWPGPDEAEKAKFLAAVQAGQQPDGGFRKQDAKGSDLETTYRVTRALHMLKVKPKDVAASKAFIAKCRNADGGYGVTPGQPSTMSGTYYAGILLHWLGE